MKLEETISDKYIICLLAIPDGYELLAKAIRVILTDRLYGWEVVRAREKFLKNSPQSNLVCHVQRSHIYLVDISDQDPDVMFQAGMMASFYEKKPTVYLCRKCKTGDICKSLLGMPLIEYDWNEDAPNFEHLVKQLSQGFRIREFIQDLKKPGMHHFLCADNLVKKDICAENVAHILDDYYLTVEDLVNDEPQAVSRKTQLKEATITHIQEQLKTYYEIFSRIS